MLITKKPQRFLMNLEFIKQSMNYFSTHGLLCSEDVVVKGNAIHPAVACHSFASQECHSSDCRNAIHVIDLCYVVVNENEINLKIKLF